MFSNGATFFPVEFSFKVSYTEVPVRLSIEQYSTHINERFDGSLVPQYRTVNIYYVRFPV